MGRNALKLALYLVPIALLVGCASSVKKPIFSITPDSWDFGNVTVSTYSDKEFEIKNTGTANLIVAAIDFTGTNASDYTVLNNDTNFEIDKKDSHKITIRFTPSAAGNSNATMQINNNTKNSIVDVPLMGVGTEAQIDITPSPWDFGGVEVGTTATKDFEVKNTGTSDLDVSTIIFTGGNSGDFAVINGGTNFIVTPGNVHAITVEFRPTATGARSTTMQFTHNAPTSPTDVQLQGTGTVAQLDITPDKWDYGVTFLGQFTDKDFEIENTGTAILSVTKIDFVSGDIKDFKLQTGGTSFQVNPGSKYTITIRFEPTALGSRRTTMQLLHNGTTSPTDVVLEGMGAIFLGTPTTSITVNNASDITGIAVDKATGKIWASCQATDSIYCIGYDSPFNQINNFKTPASNSVGLAFYKGYLYSTDSLTKKVYKISTSNGSSTELFDISSFVNNPTGLAFNGNNFFVADAAGTITVLSNKGVFVKTLNLSSTSIGNVVWDGQYLLVVDKTSDKILSIDTTSGAVVKSVGALVTKAFALGCDGTNLYTAAEATNVIKKFVP